MNFFTSKWAIAFFLLPYILMDFFFVNNMWSVYLILRSIAPLIGFSFLFIYGKINKRNFLYLSMLSCYVVAIVVSGLLNHSLSGGQILNCLMLIGLNLYVIYCMGRFEQLISGLCILFTIIISLTIALMLFNHSAVYTYYDGEEILTGIFGNKNTSQIFYLPAVGFFLILANYRTKQTKFKPLIAVALLLTFLILSQSGTAIVASVVMIFLICIYKWIKIPPVVMLLTYIAIFFGIVILDLQNTGWASSIIESLGKDPTLTNRTYIWSFTLNHIKESWLWGFGIGNNIIPTYIHIPDAIYTSPLTLNGILEILFTTGAFGLLFFSSMLILSFIRLQRTRKNLVSIIITYCIFSFFIISISESVFYIDRPFFWILMLMAINIERIVFSNKPNDISQHNTKRISISYQKNKLQ